MAQSTLTLAHMQALTNEKLALAHAKYWRLNLAALPVLDLKSRRGMGQCTSIGGREIRINYNLAALALIPESEVLEIVAHEVAHAVEVSIYGKSNHGTRWQGICSALGGNPNRTYRPDPKTLAALIEILPPKKRARYHEWTDGKIITWCASARHRKGIENLRILHSHPLADPAAFNKIKPTGREVLSASRPASVPLIGAA